MSEPLRRVDVCDADGNVIGEQWLEAGESRFTFWSCLCGAGVTKIGPDVALDCCHRKGIHARADVTHAHVLSEDEMRAQVEMMKRKFPLTLSGELLPTPPTGVTPAVEALAYKVIEGLLDIEDITPGAILDALIDARVVYVDEVSRILAALGAKPKWTIAPDSDADREVMKAWNAYCERMAELDKP